MNTDDAGKVDGSSSRSAIKTVEVTYGGMVAKLEVECTWTYSGDLFSCYTKRYWVTNNGRNSGNIFLKFSSAVVWGETELTGSAAQTGSWHNLYVGGTVKGNGKNARVEFTYIFDVSGGDPTAWNYIDINF